MRYAVLVLALCVGAPITTSATSQPTPFSENPEAIGFVDRMATEHGFDRDELLALFAKANTRPSVIERITRPAEGKPWHEYRDIFLTDKRITAGAEFWRQNASALARAEAEYGVAAEVIVAIIGVETFYGRYRGKDPVLESVGTLAFDYPKRSKFFSAELEQYLLLAREEGWDPLAVQGSYAGAMGLPQFIASSYRRLAVDFDGDGKRDLIDNVDDAIGSVAHYLAKSGWKRGETVAVPARVASGYQDILKRGLKPSTSFSELRSAGVEPQLPITGTRAALVKMDAKKGPEFWLGLDNFYAITRYNHSALYALAVSQLSEEIRDTYLQPERELDRVERAQTAKLQKLLRDAGHDPGPVDGRSGPKTREAVASFQRSAGLDVSGQADPQLLKALAN